MFQSVRLIASEAANGSSSKARNPISQGVTRTRPRQRRQRRRALTRIVAAGAAAGGGRLDATIGGSLRSAGLLGAGEHLVAGLDRLLQRVARRRLAVERLVELGAVGVDPLRPALAVAVPEDHVR